MSRTNEALASMPKQGRRFSSQRKVRLGDVTTEGRLRFDALARYAQDVSDDDTTDAGLSIEPGWVVRSTVIDELVSAELGEQLSFVTFCSGLGRSWAERRHTIVGDRSARYEVATLWICIDVTTGRPHKLTEQFQSLYATAAAERKVSARLTNPTMADFVALGAGVIDEPWPVRMVDFDVYGHMNNAAYWAVVEEWPVDDPSQPRRARLEYGAEVRPGQQLTVSRSQQGDQLGLWWRSDDGVSGGDGPVGNDGHHDKVSVSALIHPIPADLYAGG